MDIQGVAGAAKDLNPAQQTRQAEQAPRAEQQTEATKAELPKQGASGGFAPGVGGNLNITV